MFERLGLRRSLPHIKEPPISEFPHLRAKMRDARRAQPVRGKARSPPGRNNFVNRTYFLPIHADLGRRKGSSPCQSEPYRQSPTSITSNTRQKTYSGITPATIWEPRNGSVNFTRASPVRPMPRSLKRT